MADIHKAFEFLNEALNLNLTQAEITGHERGMKEKWMKEKSFPNFASENVNDWEFFAYLVPRSKPKSEEK